MNRIMYIIKKVLRHSVRLFLKFCGGLLNDKQYYKLQYFVMLGKFPNIDNPSLYTEKLQWLKLNDHNPLYTKVVDKYEVKEVIAKLIGEKYIIPTLGVWDNPEDVSFDSLPDKFVLKTTFGGGSDGVFICKDKTQLDIKNTIENLRKSYNTDPFKRAREWPYKNVPRRIIAEQYMEDDSGELRDYKFYCFNGEPKVMLLASNRFTAHNFNYFDMDFNILPITSAMGAQSNSTMEKPSCFEEMKEIASKLSKGFPHVRVDLYSCDGNVYFGELTLYDSSGYDDLNSEEWNQRFGDWITLPNTSSNDGSIKKGFGNEGIDMFY